MTVEEAVAILRDRFDLATGTVRPVSANTIASTDTTQSVVFVTDPSTPPVLWVAEPHADGYFPAPFAPFHAIGFDAAFAAEGCPDGCVGGTIPYVSDVSLDDPAGLYVGAMARLIDRNDVGGALAGLRELTDPASALMAAWLAASEGDLVGANADLERALGREDALSMHHRLLTGLLKGEIARSQGRESDAREAWAATVALARTDDPADAPLNGPLLATLRSRMATGSHHASVLPAPDLKFQDVLGLAIHACEPRRRGRSGSRMHCD